MGWKVGNGWCDVSTRICHCVVEIDGVHHVGELGRDVEDVVEIGHADAWNQSVHGRHGRRHRVGEVDDDEDHDHHGCCGRRLFLVCSENQ